MQRTISHVLLITCFLLIISCQSGWEGSIGKTSNIPVSDSLAAIDSAVIKIYQPYKRILEKDMSRIISFSENELVKDKPESALTNFLADLLLKRGIYIADSLNYELEPDVSYFNYGGIRTNIPKGEITVGNIYELMPFENELVFIELKGSDLEKFLNAIAQKGGDSLGGVRFKIKNEKSDQVTIGGKPLIHEQQYWLVTNDYVARGGDDLNMLSNRITLKESGVKIRDVIIDYLEDIQNKGQSVSAEKDGRISYE